MLGPKGVRFREVRLYHRIPSVCFPSVFLVHAFPGIQKRTASTCQPSDQKSPALCPLLPVEQASSSYGATGKRQNTD